MKSITAYKCDYCGNLFDSAIVASTHENEQCLDNPRSGNCELCLNFSPGYCLCDDSCNVGVVKEFKDPCNKFILDATHWRFHNDK